MREAQFRELVVDPVVARPVLEAGPEPVRRGVDVRAPERRCNGVAADRATVTRCRSLCPLPCDSRSERWDSQPRPPLAVRLVSATSVSVWASVIFAGRMDRLKLVRMRCKPVRVHSLDRRLPGVHDAMISFRWPQLAARWIAGHQCALGSVVLVAILWWLVLPSKSNAATWCEAFSWVGSPDQRENPRRQPRPFRPTHRQYPPRQARWSAMGASCPAGRRRTKPPSRIFLE